LNQIAKSSQPTLMPVGRSTMSSALLEAKNYHRWNFDWIAPYVRGRILDIGGGTGNHLRYLQDRDLVSIDISPDCVRDLRAQYADHPNWSFEVGDITDARILDRFSRASFDTVLSCNVFEHIERDAAAFANSAELLRPGGALVLLLPAHPMLYGSMDRLAGHYRRYTATDAREKLSAAHLEPVLMRYVNMVGGIGWFLNNRVIRHRDLSSSAINGQIRAFDRYVVPMLRRLEGSRSMFFGQSLVCVGRKASA